MVKRSDCGCTLRRSAGRLMYCATFLLYTNIELACTFSATCLLSAFNSSSLLLFLSKIFCFSVRISANSLSNFSLLAAVSELPWEWGTTSDFYSFIRRNVSITIPKLVELLNKSSRNQIESQLYTIRISFSLISSFNFSKSSLNFFLLGGRNLRAFGATWTKSIARSAD